MVAFCIILLTVYSTGCWDKCFKNGEHQKLSYRHKLWRTVLSGKKYIVLFSPDFKYEVDPFNSYIIDNCVKRTIGRCIPRGELPLAPKPLIRFIGRIISSFL